MGQVPPQVSRADALDEADKIAFLVEPIGKRPGFIAKRERAEKGQSDAITGIDLAYRSLRSVELGKAQNGVVERVDPAFGGWRRGEPGERAAASAEGDDAADIVAGRWCRRVEPGIRIE